jgi:hypothetical protein
MGIRPFACDRAREWLSLQLDGELSELERMLLQAHLDRCGSCDSFAADLDALTLELRTMSLEPLTHPVVVPRSRNVLVRTLEVGATFAAAGAVAIGLAVAGSGSNALQRVGPVFKEPEIAFDAGARGLPRAWARVQEDQFSAKQRSRRPLLDL